MGPGGLDGRGADGVELGGGRARADGLAQGGVDIGDDEARPPHEPDLVRCLDLDLLARQHRAPPLS